MSKVVREVDKNTELFKGAQIPEQKSVFGKILKVLAVLILLVVVIGAIGGFFYYRYLITTPQYSLALLIDAARRDDQKVINELVDTDEIVEDFVPQIVDKAVELYGRGVAPDVVKKISALAAPVMPVVKQRAKAELPNLIRKKTASYEKIPFWAMAVGANTYLDIQHDNEKALLKSKLKNRSFEIQMKKNGDKWKIVAIKDEKSAQQIAQKVGQEMIALANNRGKDKITKLGKKIGINNLGELFEKAQDVFK